MQRNEKRYAMSAMIHIRGARTHNLKNVDVDIPRGKLTVVTGPSGSGKSSVAFDTLYAEGQWRYAESVSSYARRFMDVMDKPDVDAIEGLSPCIAIGQSTGASLGSRSTVGTMTEINDYLRVLFARAGVPYCAEHDLPLEKSGIHDMVDAVLALDEGTRVMVLAPLKFPAGPTIADVAKKLAKSGYLRLLIDGEVHPVDDIPGALSAQPAALHAIDIVVDRIKSSDAQRARLAESFEAAVKAADAKAAFVRMDTGERRTFHTRYCCSVCGESAPELSPAMFSFNNALGACPVCEGAGRVERFDPALVVTDARLSLAQGAVCGCTPQNKANYSTLCAAARVLDFSMDVPFEELPQDIRDFVLFGPSQKQQQEPGLPEYEGVIVQLEKKWKRTTSEAVKAGMRVLRRTTVCPACEGARHRAEVRHVYVGEGEGRINLVQLENLPLSALAGRIASLTFSEGRAAVAAPLLEEVSKRVKFLVDVGLGYLTLGREASTLSGGEVQRIRLAGQLGAGLTGVTYVLDEPTVGLHQRDTGRIIDMLKKLTRAGNTVVVVEHDAEMIRAADWVVDMGPGAGSQGGEVVCEGTVKDICACERSKTGAYLSGRLVMPAAPHKRFDRESPALVLVGASGRNLKHITCRFPVGALIAVTGVSGSGKSTLINETLGRYLKKRLHRAKEQPLEFETIEGVEFFDKVIEVDQSAIGKSPRSNPATYTGIMQQLREVFAQTSAARERGYGPGRFSFNREGGACEACEGEGRIKYEMGFLPPVYVDCPVCRGRRYNRETLEVKYKGKSIADVLEMTVADARGFFDVYETIARRLETLEDVGLGYIGLGQSAVTFSGGEAQRIKLAEELARRDTGRTLYILDEPTTGLHFEDVAMLMRVLRRLTELGNTVVVIEHNTDVIAGADWVIDIGPEGGDAGGSLVFEGTPEDLVKCRTSITGQWLKTTAPKKTVRRKRAAP